MHVLDFKVSSNYVATLAQNIILVVLCELRRGFALQCFHYTLNHAYGQNSVSGQTDTQDNYCNLRYACMPRVNYHK